MPESESAPRPRAPVRRTKRPPLPPLAVVDDRPRATPEMRAAADALDAHARAAFDAGVRAERTSIVAYLLRHRQQLQEGPTPPSTEMHHTAGYLLALADMIERGSYRDDPVTEPMRLPDRGSPVAGRRPPAPPSTRGRGLTGAGGNA